MAFWSGFGDRRARPRDRAAGAGAGRPLQLPRQGAARPAHDRAVDGRHVAGADDRRAGLSPRPSTRRAITDNVDLGTVPTWPDLLFGMTVAVIAYTGIEAAANLAPEVRVGRDGAAPHRRRRARRSVLLVFVGMSAVALMALPVEQGVPMSVDNQTNGYGTALGGKCIEAPVLGVVEALTGRLRGRAARLRGRDRRDAGAEPGRERRAWSASPAPPTRSPRTGRSRAGVARLHPRYGTPWIVISIFTVLAGAAPAAARHRAAGRHVRLRRPDRVRARAPVGVRAAVQGAGPAARLQGAAERADPRPRAAAAGGARRGAVDRRLGRRPSSTTTRRACSARSGWGSGCSLYVVYRSPRGPLADPAWSRCPPSGMSQEPEVEYARILVPVFGEELDDDIMSTAGQLASEPGQRRRDDRRDLRARGADVAAARRPACRRRRLARARGGAARARSRSARSTRAWR